MWVLPGWLWNFIIKITNLQPKQDYVILPMFMHSIFQNSDYCIWNSSLTTLHISILQTKFKKIALTLRLAWKGIK